MNKRKGRIQTSEVLELQNARKLTDRDIETRCKENI